MKRLYIPFGLILALLVLSTSVFAFDPLIQGLEQKESYYDQVLDNVQIVPFELEDVVFNQLVRHWITDGDEFNVNVLRGNTNAHIKICQGELYDVDIWFHDDPNSPYGVCIEIKDFFTGESTFIYITKGMTVEELEEQIAMVLKDYCGLCKEWWIAGIMKSFIAVLRMKGIM
ncbi:MAG: hypothetical protein KAX49_20360 [Halanaerobiales bacterium]|nr:hypothetical protein [Halanaerobiales bacterium]